MRTPYRIALVLLAAAGLLAGVVGVRTVMYQPPTARTMAEAVELAPAAPVDTGRAARNLAAAIQIRTVSHQDPAENDTAEWDRLHAWLQYHVPTARAAMTRELVTGRTLIYAWAGKDAGPAADPADGRSGCRAAHCGAPRGTSRTQSAFQQHRRCRCSSGARRPLTTRRALIAIFRALEFAGGPTASIQSGTILHHEQITTRKPADGSESTQPVLQQHQ